MGHVPSYGEGSVVCFYIECNLWEEIICWLPENSTVGYFTGISPSSPKDRIITSHKKLIMLNHPDRGGSPYLAGKINEAKSKLEKAD